MKLRFTAKEVKYIFITTLVLGFVFGFDDGQEVFNLAFWFSNYLTMATLSLISIIIYLGAQKLAARKCSASATFKLWTMRRFSFRESGYLHKREEKGFKGSPIAAIPIGIVLPLLIAFLSEGKALFAITGTLAITTLSAQRIGRPFVHLTEFETAKIAYAGPLASIIVSLIASLFAPVMLLEAFIKINIALAMANMLPLPNLAGGIVFFGSKFLYIFGFAFILGAAVLMWFLNIVLAIFFALLIALIMVTTAYYFVEVAK